ncbi:MAG: DUF4174 domain-containing protein [Paracoccaceae bacterium]|nr:DUF4174 domain-containing protein [Paracoccaceae bacterium]
MSHVLRLGFIAFFAALTGTVPLLAVAQDTAPMDEQTPVDPALFAPIPGNEADLNEFIWKKRPVVVFADSAADPAFVEQMRLLQDRWPELAARDVVVIADTEPGIPSATRLKLRPRGFSLVLMTKDGQVSIRKPLPWDGREIMRAIDKMPIRREEIRNGAGG